MLEEAIQLIQMLTQQILEHQDEFTDEELEEMYSVLDRATEFVMSKIEREETPIEPTSPQVPKGAFPSSNVEGMKFDPETGTMLVQFHGPYPQAKGPIYQYGNVPKFLFDIIQRGAIGPQTSGQNAYHKWIKGVTPSLGGTVNAILKKGNFPYQKVA